MNDEYSIIITPDAEDELNAIDDYITFVLLAPETAVKYIQTMKEELSSLRYSPKRFRIVDDEPWHSRSIRRMNSKGFAVFYLIDDDYYEVYIQNIIYQKRDIQRIIREMDSNDK